MRRRTFLAAGPGGLTVTFLAGCTLPVIPKRPAPEVADALSWVRFEHGRYTLFIPRVEMGQNILTGLKQIACEELGVDWTRVDAKLPATTEIRRVRATVGSESVKEFAVPLAQACATLREAIAAGTSAGVLKAQALPVAALRSLRPGGRFVGKTMPIEQGRAIVLGEPLYAADVQLPGMLFGRVLRAPASPELRSRLLGADEAAARAVGGFVALVRDPLLTMVHAEGLGIVARTPGALDRIEAALTPRWQIDHAFEQRDIDAAVDIDTRLQAGALRYKLQEDGIDQDGPWEVDLRIDVPLAAHAPIQPRAAVADMAGEDGMQVWVGSQDVFYQRDVIAKRLGLADERVIVHGHRVGGAFGGKTICTVELEAALLARATKRPVKVQWTRAQEFQLGFHRPPSSHRIRARLKAGRLDQWWHAFASSHILFTNAAVPAWMQRLTDFIGDDGVARGANPPYRMRARRVEFDLTRLPVLTGPWRGLGAGPNVFAIECAIDECARAARIDPVQFRLDHIEDPRLSRVLRRVADAAGWRDARAPRAGERRGRGVACGIYKAMSYAAVVADVAVDDATGEIRITHMWCAHDCGLVVNPDQVRAQCEGNLVWGIGMVLVEGLSVGRSQVAAGTFADSPIPRLNNVPAMDILLVDEGDPPSGAGETAIVAAGAAVANAVRDATNVRITKLPTATVPVQPSAP
ncbi:MAG TPA: molybdopterin cofactor-binding domain-containing protein [Ideonella sp.]|uniref:xanthine dehydrogenase family protein molybdopterin-binding subunit n=1 Tax=Ideonella sp. TaxID=1929293 RepID=UPI002E34625E|nr:molybdopterin cofactor-binding domain-containing protein [Ideonella sp.]HEX5683952.1 molybdopterin cofactor-binding domain-containing protein [Ideonella sp.]